MKKFFFTILLLTGAMPVFAKEQVIPDDVAIHCILGESRGEFKQFGFNAFLAMAEALRNRGNVKNVYGCSVDFDRDDEILYLINTGIFAQAQKAWKESKNSHLVNGAQYWGSIIIDQKWIKQMERKHFIKTYAVGNTVFYRKGKSK